MRCIVRHITRKSRGGFSIKDEIADAEVLVAGRGNDCAIHLPDARILLRHAEISLRGDSLYITAMPGADVRVNGNLVHVARFDVDDVLRLGPYEIKLQTGPEGGAGREDAFDSHAMILTVELVEPIGDELQQLVRRSRTDIKAIGFSVRGWTLLFTGAAALLLFVLPFVLNLFHVVPDPKSLTRLHVQPAANPTGVWTSGTISSSHKFFGVSCETCHEKPFIPVRDSACLNCHDGIQDHAMAAAYPDASFRDTACADCHKEHMGNTSTTLNSQTFCVSCHKNLVEKTKDTNFRDVTDFALGHPEFRPTLILDVASGKTDHSRAIGDKPPPTSNSGLVFPHARHLRPGGVRDPVHGNVVLHCEDCHTPVGDGHSMTLPTFESTCHTCHKLKFDVNVPERELVHGVPRDVYKQVRDIYDAVAMRGGYEEPEAPAVIRRRPGTSLTEPEKKEVSDWAEAKTASLVNGRFGKGLCAGCHVIVAADPGGERTGGMSWDIQPIVLSNSYLPRARFTHTPHRDVACETCHKEVSESMQASEVLIPSITVCQSCHGGEKTENRVPSTCVACHRFHRDNRQAMHTVSTAPGERHPQPSHRDSVKPGTVQP